ncbi:MAG: putative PEP-binding protein [Planctomycetota bacterium]
MNTPSSPQATPHPGGESTSLLLRGASVAPGMAVGPAIIRNRDLDAIPVRRVPQAAVENELNRLRQGLAVSTAQLEVLRGKLSSGGAREEVALVDSQLDRLKDSVFLADVENLILGEQMALEGAIAKVILDFDRISRLVENQVLKERARELRDVGMRVLRNLESTIHEEDPTADAGAGQEGVLIAKELTVSEVLALVGSGIKGVVTQEGSLTGQASIVLRNLRIPALTGVNELFEAVAPGDMLLLDASEGLVHVRPETLLLEQFQELGENRRRGAQVLAPETTTLDGQPVMLCATCGNLPEVEFAVEQGMAGIGIYRTEMLFLMERQAPGVSTLEAHYRSVLHAAAGKPVTFRLADLDSSMGLPYMHAERETNPALGSAGLRALLENPVVLRRQLLGILRAGSDYAGEIGVALPRVVDVAELRAVRELLFEERYALKRDGEPYCERISVGVVIETPASIWGVADLAAEADFLAVGLDSLQQYLLVADRDEPHFSSYFERLHPFVLRALEQIVQGAQVHATPLRVFGVTTAQEENLPLLLAAGFRHICIMPSQAAAVDKAIRKLQWKKAREMAARWAKLGAPDTWDPH